jgi:isoquinoline 1-oxidoreductase beta subunit
MKFASVDCPVYGGKVVNLTPDALSVAGVERVVEIPATPMPSGGHWPRCGSPATPGRRYQRSIEWIRAMRPRQRCLPGELEATAKEPGKVVRDHGDVDGALASPPGA